MNFMKKLCTGILILSLVGSLISCGGSSENSDTPTKDNGADADIVADGGEDTASANETIVYTPSFEIKDWEGKEFTFLCTGPTYDGGYYETTDIYVEESTGEVFGDAVLKRNQNVESKYNVKITEIKSSNVKNDAEKAYKAGDDIYNAIFATTSEGNSLAQSGYLLDMNDLPNVDLSQPWWDQNLKSDLSIANKNYVMTGDISVMDDNCTMLFFFNKKLISEYGLENPYNLLKNNKWTIDEYAKLVKAVSKDLDGDGVMNESDRYGNIMAYHYIQYLVQGSGMKYAKLDSNGYPEITFMEDKTVSVINKLFDIYLDKTTCTFFNELTAPSGMNPYTYGRQLFTKDQILFCFSQPLIFYEFRDMESEFGLMPTPKYDENQDRYYCPVDVMCTYLSVPGTVGDKDFTGYVLEAFAAESKNVLTPAYYDVMLKRKYTRDDESEEILDLISRSRLYDLGVNYNFGNVANIIGTLFQNESRDIVSAYEKIENAVQTAVQKTYDAYINAATE